MHEHGPYCGHLAIGHRGHQTACTTDGPPRSDLHPHVTDHEHCAGCGHPLVPHGDHHDYLMDGHLHHPCNGHCDDHGAVEMASHSKAFRPLHDRVLVECIEEAERSKGGIIIPDTAKEKPTEGNVLAVGSGKVMEDGSTRKSAVSVGDRLGRRGLA